MATTLERPQAETPHRPVPPETYGIDPEIYRRRWWTLTVLCTSLLIVIVGNSSLNITLPTLIRELGASTSQLQWMVDAYSLVFAGLLLTAGALGDRFGRKGALQIGLFGFLAACLGASQANSASMIIFYRAMMGVSAAFIMPSTLSILTNVFPPHERTKAIATWAGIAGGGAAIGPVSSGLLLHHFWWGSVFLVNVPIIAGALVAGHFLVPKSKNPDDAPLDAVGALLSIAGIVALVYAIIEAPDRGWGSAETIATLFLAFAFIGVFLTWERQTKDPMLNLSYFKDRRFSIGSAGMVLVFFAMFGLFFLITQYFQLVLGYDALGAGLRQAPMALALMLVAPNTARLAHRFGAHRVVAGGLTLVTASMLLLALLSVDSTYLQVLGAMLVGGVGMALTMSPLTASIMSAVPLHRAGTGSAINDTTRELGGSLGVAVLGSVVSSRYVSQLHPFTAGLPAAARTAAERSLGGALQVAQQLPEAARGAFIRAAQVAFVDALHIAVLVAAASAATGAVLVYRKLPHEGGHSAMPAASSELGPPDVATELGVPSSPQVTA
jgi:EmrB/QacA subfamily drug resistance transporter